MNPTPSQITECDDERQLCEWQPIETSPKYPVVNNAGPHFIGLTENYGAIECWWDYPSEGSQAYAENRPPQIVFINPLRGGIYIRLHPTHWMPLPKAALLSAIGE